MKYVCGQLWTPFYHFALNSLEYRFQHLIIALLNCSFNFEIVIIAIRLFSISTRLIFQLKKKKNEILTSGVGCSQLIANKKSFSKNVTASTYIKETNTCLVFFLSFSICLIPEFAEHLFVGIKTLSLINIFPYCKCKFVFWGIQNNVVQLERERVATACNVM